MRSLMSEMIFDSNLSFAAILIKFHKHDYGDKIEKLIHFIILTSICGLPLPNLTNFQQIFPSVYN